MVLLVYLLITLPVCHTPRLAESRDIALRVRQLTHTSVLCVQYNLAFDLQPDSTDPQFWVALSVDMLLGADMILNVSSFFSAAFPHTS